MLSKIQTKIGISLTALALLIVPALAFSGNASAQTVQNNLCSGTANLQITTNDSTTGCADDAGEAERSVNNIIKVIINVFSVVVGIIAVIMIIVGGLKYITSGGDSGKVTSAKNSIIYAIIGLVIVALAQIIVRFVLSKATTTTP